MNERDLLVRIVAARKRMYDRAVSLSRAAEAPDDLDQREIDLLEAQLRLAAVDAVERA